MRRLPATTAYYELTPAGHCPHHERPDTVNRLLAGWLASQTAGAPEPLVRWLARVHAPLHALLTLCVRLFQPATGDAWEVALAGGGMLRAERTDGSPRNAFELADAEASARSADGRTRSVPGLTAALERLLPKQRKDASE
jgi:hypothetical protein